MEPRWSDQPNYVAQYSALQRLSPSAASSPPSSPGSEWGVRVESRFELVPPHFIDITSTITPTVALPPKTDVLGIFWASYIHCPDELAYRYRAAGDPERWTSAHDAIDHARDGPRGLIAPSGAAALLPRTWPPEPTSPLLHGPCAPRTPCSCLLASFTSSQTPSAQDDEMNIGTS